jgi:hypothetical protein
MVLGAETVQLRFFFSHLNREHKIKRHILQITGPEYNQIGLLNRGYGTCATMLYNVCELLH